MRRFAGIAIVLVIAGLVKVFTVDTGEVRSFNDKLVDLAMKADMEFDKYDTELGKYYGGAAADLAVMQSEAPRLASSMNDYNTQIAAVKVPDDDLCRAFHSSVVVYMKSRAEIAERYQAVNGLVATSNPGTELDINKLDAMIGTMLTANDGLFNQVGAAQEAMAAEHDLTLE